MNETWMKNDWKSDKCPGVKKEQKPLNGNKNLKKSIRYNFMYIDLDKK